MGRFDSFATPFRQVRALPCDPTAMEAATPLRPPRITLLGNVVVADGLAVSDRVAVDLVRDREQAGADPAGVLVDAIEIGARVLSREQAEVNAEFVRTEFEKVSREVEEAFTDKARVVAEFLGKRVDDVFGPENGHLAKELERLFGAESSVAVQHQLRTVMTEASAHMRADLLKQFSSADEHNPLADFKAGTMAAMRRAAEQQDQNLRAVNEQMAALKAEVIKLQAERAKADEVAAEHARSTAKGRPYEEAVFDALAAIAHARGDDCDAVGDVPGAGGRKGDVLVGIDGCSGPPRARIVFEAKHSYVPKNKALAELDEAMAQRDAEYAVWVVPAPDLLPGHGPELHEVNGDKLFVVFDPGGRHAGRARARLRARPRPHADGRHGRRRARRRRAARRDRARAGRDGRRAPDQVPAHGGRGRDRPRAPDPRRDGRPRARPPHAGRRARRRRNGRRLAAPGAVGLAPAAGAGRRVARQAWRSLIAAPVSSTPPA